MSIVQPSSAPSVEGRAKSLFWQLNTEVNLTRRSLWLPTCMVVGTLDQSLDEAKRLIVAALKAWKMCQE